MLTVDQVSHALVIGCSSFACSYSNNVCLICILKQNREGHRQRDIDEEIAEMRMGYREEKDVMRI